MTVNRQSTHGAGHIPICTHGPNIYVPKHIGRPMSGLFVTWGTKVSLGGRLPKMFVWGRGIPLDGGQPNIKQPALGAYITPRKNKTFFKNQIDLKPC